MPVLHRIHSRPAEGFTIHGFDADDGEFMARALDVNRLCSPPLHYPSHKAELRRTRDGQREFRSSCIRSVGFLAAFYEQYSSFEGSEPIVPVDVAYGYAGTEKGDGDRLQIKIGGLIGFDSPEGDLAMPLLARRLIVELSKTVEQETDQAIHVVDPRLALRRIFARGHEDYRIRPQRYDRDGVYSMELDLPEFWQQQADQRDRWSMPIDHILGHLATSFPETPLFLYQDHRTPQ